MNFKKIFLFLPPLLFASFFANAQRAYVDSVLKVYPTQQGMNKLKSRNNLAFFYAPFNRDSAFYYVNESLKEAKQLKNDSIYIRALTIKGIIFSIANEQDSAKAYHLKSIEICQLLGHDEEQSSAINNIGMIEWNLGNYETALSYFFESLKIDEEYNDLKGSVISMSNIGLIYMEMKQYKRAMKYIKKSLQLKKDNGIQLNIEKDYSNMGICYRQMDQIDSAKWAFEIALKKSEAIKNEREIATAINGLATVAHQQGDYETALRHTLRALEINDRLADISLITNHINLAGIYYALGKYRQGLSNAHIAKEYIGMGYAVELGRKVYIFSALSHAALGNRDSALYELDQYIETVDSLFSAENAHAISNLEIKYETEKKEKQLLEEQRNVMQQRAALAESNLKLSNRNNLLIVSILTAIIIVVASLYWVQRNKRKTEREKERLVEQERQKSLELLIETQEKERKRISKDLHDGVGQQLTGLKMAWTTLYKEIIEYAPNVAVKIKELSQELGKSTEEVRAISHTMMPKTLQQLGLAPALEHLVEKTFNFSTINASFEAHNANQRFDEKVEICFYRIAQELINNCIKHAEANLVTIQLIKSKKHLSLLVEDNGKGMNITSTNGHGIANIATRISSIGGNVNYDSSPNGGTLVTVRVAI